MTVLFNMFAIATHQMLIFVLFCVFVSFYIHLIWKTRHMLKKSWNMPGPFNIPVIGSSYIFFCRQKVWFGHKLVYSLQEPDHIEKIIGNAKFLDKDVIYNEVRSCIGEGLLTAPLSKWKKHRRIIAPSFNRHVLNSLVNTFAEKSQIFNNILDENCQKELHVEKLVTRCVLDITLGSLFGMQFDIQKTNTGYADTMEKMFSLIFKKIWVRLTFWNTFDDDEFKSCINGVYDVFEKGFQQKIKCNNKEKATDRYFTKVSVEFERLAFLDHIIESGQFNALELKEEMMTIVGAGSDTIVSAINSIFAVLGMFPQIQQKVYEEIIEILGNDRLPEHDNLHQMIYMERVIKETLRLFPPAPYFLRFISEDADVGDFIIPKGANVLFGLLFIHRNPKYWPNPLKFDPDRFLPEEVAKRHPCTYMPFSYGKRNCIGLQYAMMNIIVILSTVIRKFKIHCEYNKIEDIHFKVDFILRFQDGTKVTMTPRK